MVWTSRCIATAGFVLAASALSCAAVQTRTYDTDKFVRVDLIDTPPAEPPDTSVQWHFENDELVVSLDRYWTCHRQQVNVFHKTRTRERKLKDGGSSVVLYSLVGAILTPIGAYCATSGDACDGKYTDDKGEEQTSDGETYGAVALGFGLTALGLAAIEGIRSRDSTEDLGEFQRSVGEGEPYACREDAGEGAEAKLVLPGNAGAFSGAASVQGEIRFKLTEFEKLAALGTTAQLVIGGKTQPVSLLQCGPFLAAYAKRMEVKP